MARVPTAEQAWRGVLAIVSMTVLVLLAMPSGAAAAGCTANGSPGPCPTLEGSSHSNGAPDIALLSGEESPPVPPGAAPTAFSVQLPVPEVVDEDPPPRAPGPLRKRVGVTAPEPVEPPVLALTAEPDPPKAAAVPRRHTPPPPPPAAEESERSTFAASIPRPQDVSWSTGHVAGNAALALLLVLLLGLPAEVLNSSIKARAALRPARAPWAPLAAVETKVNALPDPTLLIGFGLISAIVYSQLDPDVGFDRTSMLFVGSLAFALIVVTGVLEAIRIPYLRRRHEVGSHLRMFPKALVAAVVLVILSRATGFHPGFIFGVTCGLAVSGRLEDEDEGRSIAVACAGLLMVSVVAWLLWIPASDAASADHPSTWAILVDTFLATLWVTGLQVVLFGLVPLKFLYGEKVMRWSRTGWLALYGTAMFLFVQTLLHPSSGEWGGFSDGMMLLLGVSVVVMLLLSLAFWFWVRLRAPEPDAASAPALV